MDHRISFLTLMLSACLLYAFNSPKSGNNAEAELGQYSISLAVKDIQKSHEFYAKMGFKPLEGMGSIEQKWIILSNGDSKIGLFQGFFPSNSLAFNPKEARGVYKHLKQGGIQTSFEQGMDQDKGPCSFVLLDPDGNSILIDQH